MSTAVATPHSHNFLGDSHADKEWRTWAVISVCFAAMIIEITCGSLFGSLALVADGLHMGTHVFAFLIAATSYSYSRLHSEDERFVFGTGKVGELSSFTCAIVLLAISMVIIYEGIYQLIYPVALNFVPALIVSFVGLSVNVASGFLLIFPCGDKTSSGPIDHGHTHGHAAHEYRAGFDFDVEEAVMNPVAAGHTGHDHTHQERDHDHDHGHDHGQIDHGHQDHGHQDHGHADHGHGHGHGHSHDEVFEVQGKDGTLELSIFEDGVPPEFRLQFLEWHNPMHLAQAATEVTVKTIRPDGSQQVFKFAPLPGTQYLHSTVDIPEPHEFDVELKYHQETFKIEFREGSSHHEGHSPHSEHSGHDDLEVNLRGPGGPRKYEQDNNFRAAVLHVTADAFVSVLTIIAIAVAGTVPGAWWLNPAAGVLGSIVIASWSYQLICDTLSALLDLSPDPELNAQIKKLLEADGETTVVDAHVWRLGPGRLGAIFSVTSTVKGRVRSYYWAKLKRITALAHVTIEILE